MDFKIHPEMSIRTLRVGREKRPLMVIDNALDSPEHLIALAAATPLTEGPGFFPGLRVAAPDAYAAFLINYFQDPVREYFGVEMNGCRFTMSHFSLVSRPPGQLNLLQRIPHFDSFDSNSLASVHYLFRGKLGGTSFYRHRKTGFEYIDAERRVPYFRSLESENGGDNMPERGYINGDTPLYERIWEEEGIFNRMVIYPKNSLHSASISADFRPDTNPLTGRLSVNCFFEPT